MLAALGMPLVMLSLTGCEGLSFLSQRQHIDRPDMPLQRLNSTPISPFGTPSGGPNSSAGLTNPVSPDSGGSIFPPVEPQQTGQFQFTIPPTVTNLKRSTDSMQQYRLFAGRPGPTDSPFLVMTVAASAAPNTPEPGSQPVGHRTYTLNGLMAEEWTGYTPDKLPYSELLITSEHAATQLFARAVARNEEQRKLALDVLGSIHFEPTAK